MGLGILSPRSCLSGIPALHPIATRIPQCLATTSLAGVMEKNERAKNSTGAQCGEQFEEERIKSMRETHEWRFLGATSQNEID